MNGVKSNIMGYEFKGKGVTIGESPVISGISTKPLSQRQSSTGPIEANTKPSYVSSNTSNLTNTKPNTSGNTTNTTNTMTTNKTTTNTTNSSLNKQGSSNSSNQTISSQNKPSTTNIKSDPKDNKSINQSLTKPSFPGSKK